MPLQPSEQFMQLNRENGRKWDLLKTSAPRRGVTCYLVFSVAGFQWWVVIWGLHRLPPAHKPHARAGSSGQECCFVATAVSTVWIIFLPPCSCSFCSEPTNECERNWIVQIEKHLVRVVAFHCSAKQWDCICFIAFNLALIHIVFGSIFPAGKLHNLPWTLFHNRCSKTNSNFINQSLSMPSRSSWVTTKCWHPRQWRSMSQNCIAVGAVPVMLCRICSNILLHWCIWEHLCLSVLWSCAVELSVPMVNLGASAIFSIACMEPRVFSLVFAKTIARPVFLLVAVFQLTNDSLFSFMFQSTGHHQLWSLGIAWEMQEVLVRLFTSEMTWSHLHLSCHCVVNWVLNFLAWLSLGLSQWK